MGIKSRIFGRARGAANRAGVHSTDNSVTHQAGGAVPPDNCNEAVFLESGDSLLLRALEPRILLDAAGVETGFDLAEKMAIEDAAQRFPDSGLAAGGAVPDDGTFAEAGENLAAAGNAADGSVEIVFVDGSIRDLKSIIAGIGPGYEAVFLSGDQDGVSQIAGYLDGRRDVDAIHIFAHGRSGTLELGDAKLTAASINDKHADEMTVIRDALGEDADILIYGCNFAAGTRGQAAVTVLMEATGADVSASNDMTGAAVLGGDWDLEVTAGDIEATSISAEAWDGLLASGGGADDDGGGSGIAVTGNVTTNIDVLANDTVMGAAVLTQIVDPSDPSNPLALAVGVPVQLTTNTIIELLADGTLDVTTSPLSRGAESFDYVFTDAAAGGQATVTLDRSQGTLINVPSNASGVEDNNVPLGITVDPALFAGGAQLDLIGTDTGFRDASAGATPTDFTIPPRTTAIRITAFGGNDNGAQNSAGATQEDRQTFSVNIDLVNGTYSGHLLYVIGINLNLNENYAFSGVALGSPSDSATVTGDLSHDRSILTVSRSGNTLSLVESQGVMDQAYLVEYLTADGTSSAYLGSNGAILDAGTDPVNTTATIATNTNANFLVVTIQDGAGSTNATQEDNGGGRIVVDLDTGLASGVLYGQIGRGGGRNVAYAFTDYDITSGAFILDTANSGAVVTGDTTGTLISTPDYIISMSGSDLVLERSSNFASYYGELINVQSYERYDVGSSATALGSDAVDGNFIHDQSLATWDLDIAGGAETGFITLALSGININNDGEHDHGATARIFVDLVNNTTSGSFFLLRATDPDLIVWNDVPFGTRLIDSPNASANFADLSAASIDMVGALQFDLVTNPDGSQTLRASAQSESDLNNNWYAVLQAQWSGREPVGITGYPNGGTFSKGSYNPLSGEWEVDASDIAGMQFIPPEHFSGITTTMIVDYNGNTQNMDVSISRVADLVSIVTNDQTVTGGATTAIGNAVAVAFVDDDGSETITLLELSNIPVGATVSDGTNSFTATAGNQTADITGWTLANLEYTPAPGQVSAVVITVAATNKDTDGFSATDDTNTTTSSFTINMDTDGNGVLDTVDIDADGDGILDITETPFASMQVAASVSEDATVATGNIVAGQTTAQLTSTISGGSGTFAANSAGDGRFRFFEWDGHSGSVHTIVSDTPLYEVRLRLDSIHEDTVLGDFTLEFEDGTIITNAAFSLTSTGGSGLATANGGTSITSGGVGQNSGYIIFDDSLNIGAEHGGVVSISLTHQAGLGSTTAVAFYAVDGRPVSDSDGDGIADYLDIDSDNDGITDNVEAQATNAYVAPSGNDADGDGLDDVYDANDSDTSAAASVGLTPVDSDGDGTTDFLDADSDNDGTGDIAEREDSAPISLTSTTDTDGDGLLDIFEGADAADGYDANDENVSTAAGATVAALSEYALGANPTLANDFSNYDLLSNGAPSVDLLFRDANDAPVAVANSYTTNEDTAVSGNVISDDTGAGADSDIDGDTLTLDASSVGTFATAQGGSITLASNGAFTYTPLANFNGTDTFSYTVSDGALTDTATLTFNVTQVNDAPTVDLNDDGTTSDRNFAATYTENTAAVAVVAATSTITDPDDASLVTFDIDLGGFGDSGNEEIAIGSATLTFGTALTAQVTIGATTFDVVYDGANAIDVTKNGGGKLSRTETEALMRTVTYRHTGDNPTLGNRTLSFTANDGQAVSNTAVSTITIVPVNDAPAGTDNTIAINEDGTHTFAAGDFGFSDPAEGDALLSVIIATLPSAAEGTLTLSGAAVTAGQEVAAGDIANLVFTPVADLNGTGLGSFTFQVKDDGGTANGGVNTDPSPNSISFNITNVNDAPVAVDDGPVTVTEDTPASGNVLTNDTDADGNTLSVTTFTIAGDATTYNAGDTATITGIGTLTMTANGAWTFIPASNYTGAVPTATYTVSDGNGGTDTGDLVFSGVSNANDAPDINLDPNNDSGTPSDLTDDGADDGGFEVTFNENDSPVAIVDADVLVSDPDDDILEIAVTLTDGKAGDTINFPNTLPGNVSATAVPGPSLAADGTLTLTLTGDASTTVADWSAILQSLTFAPSTTDPNNPDEADRNITIQAFDSAMASSPLRTTIVHVVALNDVPTLDLDADNSSGINAGNYQATYVEGAAAEAISDGALITDLDDTHLEGLTVVLTNGEAGDSLTVGTLPAGITLSGGAPAELTAPGTITVDLTGSATLADYQTAIAAISFANSSDDPVEGIRQITVTGTDGEDSTPTRTAFITVLAVNDPPTIVDPNNPGTPPADPNDIIPDQAGSDSAALTALDASVYFNDPDSVGLTYSLGTGAPSWLSINATSGVITGTPPANASQNSNIAMPGSYDVLVVAEDPDGATGQTTVTYVIGNPAPTATDDNFAINEGDGSATANIITGNNGNGPDSDPDGDALAVSAVNGVAGNVGSAVAGDMGGLFTIAANGALTFAENGSFEDLAGGETRTTRVTYTLDDGEGETATATVSVTVTGTNDAPVVMTGSEIADATGDDAETITPIDVKTAFNDPDGSDTLTYTATGLPAGLSLNPTTGIISGTIGSSASQNGNTGVATDGIYTVQVTASDGNGGTVSDTFLYAVGNPAPVAQGDAFSTDQDTTISGENVLADNGSGADADPDGDAPLIISQVDGAAPNVGQQVAGTSGGLFTISGNGGLSFDPNGDFDYLGGGENATTTVTYQLSDGEGGFHTATVTVTVSGFNDGPMPVDPANPGTPPADPNNYIPVQSADDGETIAAFDVTPYVSDPDATDTLIFTIDPAELPPGLSFNGTQISGTLASSASVGGDDPLINPGRYLIPLTVTDGDGATFTTTITYNVSNPAPHARDDNAATDEDTVINGSVFADNGNGTDSDPDGDTFIVTLVNGDAPNVGMAVTGSSGGAFTIHSDGSYAFDPGTDFRDLADGEVRTTFITYTIDDGNGGTDQATFTVTVNGSNNAPVIIDPTQPVIDPNDPPVPADPNNFLPDQGGSDSTPLMPFDVSPYFHDFEGNAMTFSLEPGAPGWLSIDAVSGILTGTPPSDGSIGGPGGGGIHVITLTATDSNGDSVSTTIDYTISNPPPVSTGLADQAETAGAAFAMETAGSFSDPDGDTLSFSANGLPAGLSIDPATGRITGTIHGAAASGGPGGNGVYSVSVTADDGQGGTATVSFAFTVGETTNPGIVPPVDPLPPVSGPGDPIILPEPASAVGDVVKGISPLGGNTGIFNFDHPITQVLYQISPLAVSPSLDSNGLPLTQMIEWIEKTRGQLDRPGEAAWLKGGNLRDAVAEYYLGGDALPGGDSSDLVVRTLSWGPILFVEIASANRSFEWELESADGRAPGREIQAYGANLFAIPRAAGSEARFIMRGADEAGNEILLEIGVMPASGQLIDVRAIDGQDASLGLSDQIRRLVDAKRAAVGSPFASWG